MKKGSPGFLSEIPHLLMMPPLEPERQSARILAIERDVVLPVKLLLIPYIFFTVFYSEWFHNPQILRDYVQDILKWAFVVYTIVNVLGARFILAGKRVQLKFLRAVVLTLCLLDGMLVAGLTYITDGFDSTLYWVFLALVVRNAISMPAMEVQIILQVATNLCFVFAGLLDIWVSQADFSLIPQESQKMLNLVQPENQAEPFFLRLFLLALLSVCCYGLQMLFERQRLSEEESREFSLRNEQVKTAGRLAAEIAHQIKNPLAIINNTAWSLQRSLGGVNGTVKDQLGIIREEVERSDRIITELMGYARLAEGRVERLTITGEMDAAIEEVFPEHAGFKVAISRKYESGLPTLLMQRGHLREIFVNLFQNAREAMGNEGKLIVSASHGPERSVIATVEDSGPGIEADKVEQIFEAYYTTREKGTGLGLAIVRNNMELYGGAVRAESGLGKGARFILVFPARTVAKTPS